MTETQTQVAPGIAYLPDDTTMVQGWFAYSVAAPVNFDQFRYQFSEYLQISPEQNQDFTASGTLAQATQVDPCFLWWRPPSVILNPDPDSLIEFSHDYSFDADWSEPDAFSQQFQAVIAKAVAGTDLTDSELQIGMRGLLRRQ